jgi:hypothetical protein
MDLGLLDAKVCKSALMFVRYLTTRAEATSLMEITFFFFLAGSGMSLLNPDSSSNWVHYATRFRSFAPRRRYNR